MFMVRAAIRKSIIRMVPFSSPECSRDRKTQWIGAMIISMVLRTQKHNIWNSKRYFVIAFVFIFIGIQFTFIIQPTIVIKILRIYNG